MMKVDRLLAAIAALSPHERTVLWRRAVAMGLLDPAAVTRGEEEPSTSPPTAEAVDAMDEETVPGESLVLVFDGGSRGNPGPGYGSYAFIWPGRSPEVHRLRFGRLTNNEAEYDTLVAALEALLARLARAGVDPERVTLEVRGDSQLVINQLSGVWRVREERLRRRWQQAQTFLQRFGQVTLRHQPRERSVAILGH